MIDQKIQEQLRARFNPDGSLLRRHQLRMLEMLKYIDAVCRKYNIKYWLCSGTLLGAVRHGGFIPWDDDLDIEMLKGDYKKFVEVMKYEKNNDFVIQTYETDPNFYFEYAKLRDLHSTIVETNNLYYKYNGIFIDIFVLEPSSSLKLSQFSRYLRFLPQRIFCKSNVIADVLFYIYRHCIFPILSILSLLGSRGQLRQRHGSFFLKPRYMEDIFPLKEICFEGFHFAAPNNADAYLRKIYGDYTCLPEISRIRVHTLDIRFDCIN